MILLDLPIPRKIRSGSFNPLQLGGGSHQFHRYFGGLSANDRLPQFAQHLAILVLWGKAWGMIYGNN